MHVDYGFRLIKHLKIRSDIKAARMVVRFMAHKNFDALLELLQLHGDLHGPVRGDDGVVRFLALSPGRPPDLASLRTQIPPKKYLLHPQETILSYSPADGYHHHIEGVRPTILFGLHPCDLAAIQYLDQVFLGEAPDPIYSARRSDLMLIGISCTPDEFCSCHRSPSSLPAASDLFFTVVDGGYAVTSGSPCGDELIESAQNLFEERDIATPEDTRSFFGQPLSGRPGREPDAGIPEWQELSDHCLGCGACSLCCPTCYCFDVQEFACFDGCTATRIRQWDNCLSKSFAEVAGGISFRKDRAERFRYRYRHKYRGFGPLQGIPSCVGCGRCRSFCPAGLDLRPLAERMKGGVP